MCETGALVVAVTMSRNTTPEEQERLGMPLFEFSSAQMETRGAQTAIIDYLKSGWDAQDGAFKSDFDSTAGKKVQTEVIRLMKDNAAMAGVEEEECRFACYNCSSHNHKVWIEKNSFCFVVLTPGPPPSRPLKREHALP